MPRRWFLSRNLGCSQLAKETLDFIPTEIRGASLLLALIHAINFAAHQGLRNRDKPGRRTRGIPRDDVGLVLNACQ